MDNDIQIDEGRRPISTTFRLQDGDDGAELTIYRDGKMTLSGTLSPDEAAEAFLVALERLTGMNIKRIAK